MKSRSNKHHRKKEKNKTKKCKNPPVFHTNSLKNKRPVIGILTIPVSKHKLYKSHKKKLSYLPSSYVKWIEMSGAKVLPIPLHWSKKKILSILKQVNGVLFPGGSIDRSTVLDYYQYTVSYKLIFDYAKKQKSFALFSICLGFEYMLILSKMNPTDIIKKEIVDNDYESLLRDKLNAGHQNVSLNIIDNKNNSLFFKDFRSCDFDYFKKKCIYMNHHYGLLFNKENKKKFNDEIDILSTNKDKDGLEYISTIQFKKYPFFGTQWHPEKPLFEWGDEKITHSLLAKHISQKVSSMFISECQKNKNVLVDQNLLINYYTLYSRKQVMHIIDPAHKNKKNSSIFEECYYFTT